MMTNGPVKEKHAFKMGDGRWVSVDEENDVYIKEDDSAKRAYFPASRWTKFTEEVPNIDKAVQRAMMLKPTDYKLHVGGNWHVTVTDEIPIVDFH